MNTAATSRDTALALWQRWGELWNGDLSQAEQILASGLTVHAAIVGVDGAAVQGARGVAGWVALLRKALGEPAFTLEVGPIIDGNLLCGRWHLQGQYAGGMPGATAAPGSRVDSPGTAILRIDNGLRAADSLDSDVHVMAAQLGMTISRRQAAKAYTDLAAPATSTSPTSAPACRSPTSATPTTRTPP